MAIAPLPYLTPAGVVAGARDDLGGLTEVLWSARRSSELVAGVEELQRLKSAAAALEAQLLAEIDHRNVSKTELAWASTADWFTHCAGTTRSQGKRTVEHARRLVAEQAATLDALRDGVLSAEQAGVIVDAVEQLPLAADLRHRGEQALLTEAGRLNATDLHRTSRHLIHVVDPTREERQTEAAMDRADRRAHLGRGLSITTDGCGGIRLRGSGTVEDGATLRTALLALSAPVSTIDPETCEEQPDPRDHGARLWDALVHLAQHALDTNAVPHSHGSRPRVSVTVSHDDLHDQTVGPGQGVTEDGLDLAPSAVRRMACDCDLIRIPLDADGCVLDVGRTRRLVTPAIWTALIVRDAHCAFPGCSRHPVMCHAHHIRHWFDGGPTSLDNLVLLCGHHHRTVHHTPWHVRLGTDRRPEFKPPPKHGRPPPDWTRVRPRLE